MHQFSSIQLLSHVWLFVTPWIAARQASLSITNSQNSLRLTSIESVMPSNHLILCRPLFLLPPIYTVSVLCFGFLAPRHVGSSLPVRGWTLTFCTGSEVLATELPGKSLASAYSLIDLLCWALCDPLNIYVQAPWWHRVNAQYSFGVTYRWMWLYECIISKI